MHSWAPEVDPRAHHAGCSFFWRCAHVAEVSWLLMSWPRDILMFVMPCPSPRDMHELEQSAGVEHDWQFLLNHTHTHTHTCAPFMLKSSEVRWPLVSLSWRRKEKTLAMAPGAWPRSLTNGPSISPAATIKQPVTETPRWITVGRHPETGASCGHVTFVKLSFAPNKGLWEGKK